MGMFCALGVILATHFTASEREPAWVRVASAVALPVLGVTLYFTFSRGGIAVAIVGTVAYVILAHPRGLVAALPAAGIPLAVALHSAYGADLLAEYNYAGADARAQGRSLLVVVIACMAAAGVLRWLALRIDRRMLRARIGARTSTIVFSGVGHRRAARAVGGDGGVRPPRQDRRAAPGVRARQHAAGHLRSPNPAHGGRQQRPAGDLARRYRGGEAERAARRRRRHVPARVGARPARAAGARGRRPLALLRGAGRARLDRDRPAPDRLRGPDRGRRRAPVGARAPRHAAFLAAGTALLLHAMVDWDWEMPALFIWFFGAAGAIIAAPGEATENAREPKRVDAHRRRARRSCSSRSRRCPSRSRSRA